jgi:hypothetical protein
MEDKRQKQEHESGAADIGDIEIKRHEVEGLTNQLEDIQKDQKEVFLAVFQVRQNLCPLLSFHTVLPHCLQVLFKQCLFQFSSGL